MNPARNPYAPAAEQPGRELPNYIRERSFGRPLALVPLTTGLNVLIGVFLDDGSVAADSVTIALEVVVASMGVLCLGMGALLLWWPRPRAWLTGTTLVTTSLFQRRRVDLTTARLAIRQHILIATDPSARRSARLPLVRAGGVLPAPDLIALADASHAAAYSNPAARQAWAVGNGLRDLAVNEALRSSVARKLRRQQVVLAVTIGVLLGISVLLMGLRVVASVT
ncbi:MAG: hypothetical protein GEV07_12845 [Streptosporangiales bacterium]|nr:hypothetical protein [Streptosporangiales bacterium]